MKTCYDDLDKMIKDFKSGKYSKEDKTIAFTPTELNLIRIIVGVKAIVLSSLEYFPLR